jgi:hypothetical protein
MKGDDSPIFDADLKITDIRKGEQQYNKITGTYRIKEVYGTFKPRFPENGTFLADLDTMRSSMIIPGKSADAKDVIVTFSDREEFIGGEWRIDTEADVNYTGKFKANYLIKDQN